MYPHMRLISFSQNEPYSDNKITQLLYGKIHSSYSHINAGLISKYSSPVAEPITEFGESSGDSSYSERTTV